MQIFNRTKGQSLVEVVVALAIIAVVFSGTVNLIVNVVKLNLGARDRTQATALAEKATAEAIQNLKSNCNVSQTNLDSKEKSSQLHNMGGKNFYLSVNLDFVNITSGSPVVNANGQFIKITTTINWPAKNGGPNIYDYVTEQIVRRES